MCFSHHCFVRFNPYGVRMVFGRIKKIDGRTCGNNIFHFTSWTFTREWQMVLNGDRPLPDYTLLYTWHSIRSVGELHASVCNLFSFLFSLLRSIVGDLIREKGLTIRVPIDTGLPSWYSNTSKQKNRNDRLQWNCCESVHQQFQIILWNLCSSHRHSINKQIKCTLNVFSYFVLSNRLKVTTQLATKLIRFW